MDEKIIRTETITDVNGVKTVIARLRGRFGMMWVFLDDEGDWQLPFFAKRSDIVDEINLIAQG